MGNCNTCDCDDGKSEFKNEYTIQVSQYKCFEIQQDAGHQSNSRKERRGGESGSMDEDNNRTGFEDSQ